MTKAYAEVMAEREAAADQLLAEVNSHEAGNTPETWKALSPEEIARKLAGARAVRFRRGWKAK